MGDMGGEIWDVVKPEVLAPISDALTETGGSTVIVGGTVESVNKGVDKGMVHWGWEYTGEGHGATVIGVEEVVVLGEGGGESKKSS